MSSANARLRSGTSTTASSPICQPSSGRILPLIHDVPLSRLVRATGLSLRYVSLIRRAEKRHIRGTGRIFWAQLKTPFDSEVCPTGWPGFALKVSE
jgi:hypothetical protein